MKLIRDRYEKIIEPECLSKVKSVSEYKLFLELKLQEELDELAETAFSDVEEFADVLEVLFTIAEANGVGENEILESRDIKRDAKGGFMKGLLLK